MHQSLVKFSESEASNQMPSLADFRHLNNDIIAGQSVPEIVCVYVAEIVAPLAPNYKCSLV